MQLILSNRHQPTLICLWPIVEDGITTLCRSTALCQTEHPVRCHLNKTCKTCVRFLSISMKGDLDDNGFRKVCILPDLGNWWINMYLCVFEIQIVHHILQVTNSNMAIPLLRDMPAISKDM